MSNPRVVADTSVILMPIIRTESSDSWLREAWEQGTITPLISDATEDELLNTLRNPRFGLTKSEVRELANGYLGHCQKIAIPTPPPPTPPCRDVTDQPFLVLAYQSEASYLVTRDDDLLELKDESEISIIRPSELLTIITRELDKNINAGK